MKKLITLVLALAASCTSAAKEAEHQIPVGTTFNVPCQEHGQHLTTITGVKFVVIYELADDTGAFGQAPETELLEWVETYGVPLDFPKD
jgi:hypothetical protein